MKKQLIISAAFKASDTDSGTFTAIANKVNIVDRGGDLTMPGAFKNDLAENGATRPLFWAHQQDQILGTVTLKEVPQVGLVVTEGRLVLEVQKAAEAYALLKAGALTGLSIGYETIKEKYTGGVRQLHEVKVHEVSLVALPMNQDSRISSVKTEADELREMQDFYAGCAARRLAIEAEGGFSDLSTRLAVETFFSKLKRTLR